MHTCSSSGWNCTPVGISSQSIGTELMILDCGRYAKQKRKEMEGAKGRGRGSVEHKK